MMGLVGPAGLWPRLLIAASLFAGVEFGLTLSLGRFLEWSRAEPLLFLAFRPWVLLGAALIGSSRPAAARWLLYAATLLLATFAEALFVRALGSIDPWSASARGLGAGVGIALVFDLLVQAGRRFRRAGLAAAALAGLALLLVPGALRLYEAVVLGPPPRASAGPKPELMLFTALPIIWGEGGAFAPDARPAASYRYLQQEYRVRPLDVLDMESLGQGRLLLLAQPRALAPAEFVALDSWVRGGGRAAILTDPALVWPTELPLGDVRRPPSIGMLGPLLHQWKLGLEPPRDGGVREELFDWRGVRRRLATAGFGRFTSSGENCRLWLPASYAWCRIGEGQVWLAADADLMNDALWAPAVGDDLRRRTADNPLLVADWLDSLAGLGRERIAPPVQWIDEGASRTGATLIGILPLLLAGVAGLGKARIRRG